jgi:septal ring-binding cell division protein DamX
MDMGGGNLYAMWGKGRMFGGMFDRPPEMSSMQPFWLVYIHVKDVGKAMDIATKAGAFVQRPRLEIPGGTIAILGDPQGAGFALHDLSAGGMSAASAAKAPPSRAKSKSTSKARSAKKPAAKKAVKKAAKKAAKKGGTKSAKKTTRTASRAATKSAKKSGRKPARKSARKSAKKSAKRRR